MALKDINLIDRRLIEAQVVVPLTKAFAEEIGLDKAKEVLAGLNQETALKYGREVAEKLGSNTIKDLAEEMSTWGADGVLEEEVVELSETVYRFNVTRCRFAEKYKELGFEEFGVCLSCCRDESFAQGFNPELKFTRTGTIMEGAEACDFLYELEIEEEPEPEAPAEPKPTGSIWGRTEFKK